MGCLYDGMLLLAIAVFVGAVAVVVGSYALMLPVDSPAGKLPSAYLYLVVFPAMLLAMWGYYLLCWRKVGQTLGMQTLYLKTVNGEGKHLTYAQGLKRCLCASVLPLICAMCASVLYGSDTTRATAVAVSVLLGLLMNYGFIWINPHGLALHDYLSKTLTVRIDPPQHESFIKRLKNPTKGSQE